MKFNWTRTTERELNHFSELLFKITGLIIYDGTGWPSDEENMAKGIKMSKNQKPGYKIPAVKFWVMIQNFQEVRTEKKIKPSEGETFLFKCLIHQV